MNSNYKYIVLKIKFSSTVRFDENSQKLETLSFFQLRNQQNNHLTSSLIWCKLHHSLFKIFNIDRKKPSSSVERSPSERSRICPNFLPSPGIGQNTCKYSRKSRMRAVRVRIASAPKQVRVCEHLRTFASLRINISDYDGYAALAISLGCKLSIQIISEFCYRQKEYTM